MGMKICVLINNQKMLASFSAGGRSGTGNLLKVMEVGETGSWG